MQSFWLLCFYKGGGGSPREMPTAKQRKELSSRIKSEIAELTKQAGNAPFFVFNQPYLWIPEEEDHKRLISECVDEVKAFVRGGYPGLARLAHVYTSILIHFKIFTEDHFYRVMHGAGVPFELWMHWRPPPKTRGSMGGRGIVGEGLSEDGDGDPALAHDAEAVEGQDEVRMVMEGGHQLVVTDNAEEEDVVEED